MTVADGREGLEVKGQRGMSEPVDNNRFILLYNNNKGKKSRKKDANVFVTNVQVVITVNSLPVMTSVTVCPLD